MSTATENNSQEDTKAVDKIVAFLSVKSEAAQASKESGKADTSAVDKIVSFLSVNHEGAIGHEQAEMTVVDKLIAFMNINKEGDSAAAPSEAGFSEIKQAVVSVVGIFVGLFVLAIVLPNNSKTETPASVSTPPTSGSTAPAAPAAKMHHRMARRTLKGSVPSAVTAYHLYGQDYKLSWKNMGDQYTYRVYYADDKHMHNAAEAFYRPIVGTEFRFTMNDPKNVWMAVAPVDANQQEGHLSQAVNIAQATLPK